MRRHRPWTAQEDDLLRALWADRSLIGADIADRLRRSVAACWSRRKLLGLPARAESPMVLRERAQQARATRAAQLTAQRRAVAPITTTDAIWLAGVLDGQGTLVVVAGTLRIELVSARRALIASAWQASGHLGRVAAPRHRQKKNKASWHWIVDGCLVVQSLLRAIRPHLRARHGLADLLLAWPPTDDGAGTRDHIRAAIAEWREREDRPA